MDSVAALGDTVHAREGDGIERATQRSIGLTQAARRRRPFRLRRFARAGENGFTGRVAQLEMLRVDRTVLRQMKALWCRFFRIIDENPIALPRLTVARFGQWQPDNVERLDLQRGIIGAAERRA
jgi:hypothetical protein